MKIIGSNTSPFVRIVRVLCAELNIDYTLDLIPPFAKMTAEDISHISKKNPLMKIPILVDCNQTVIDSRIIVNYILRKNNSFTLSPDEENVLSIIYGIIDAGILRFIMLQDGVDLNSGYMKKSYERIEDGFSFLNKQSKLGNNLGLCEIALICCLEWFDKRQIFDWCKFSSIQKIYNSYKNLPSLIQTRIPDDA